MKRFVGAYWLSTGMIGGVVSEPWFREHVKLLGVNINANNNTIAVAA